MRRRTSEESSQRNRGGNSRRSSGAVGIKGCSLCRNCRDNHRWNSANCTTAKKHGFTSNLRLHLEDNIRDWFARNAKHITMPPQSVVTITRGWKFVKLKGAFRCGESAYVCGDSYNRHAEIKKTSVCMRLQDVVEWNTRNPNVRSFFVSGSISIIFMN